VIGETWAVFGGSFDPPHVAHTLVAAYVRAAYPVTRVLVTPTGTHAFGKQLAPFADRVAMCRLAFADLRAVELSTIEETLPKPNLTVDTLTALHERDPEVALRLVLGTDLRSETHAWHDFARISQLAPPIWIERQGHGRGDTQLALPDISSSEVRRRLAAGEPTDGLLGPAVADYVARHGLYRDPR
jgi:nicotinate-nucleotide adenylyltransferase